MSTSDELLEFLRGQREESRLQQLLENKGYSNSRDDDFGLNQWTSRLTPSNFGSEEKKQDSVYQRPDHFVSFLAIPDNWSEELLDTNSPELQSWISKYSWHQIPGTHPPLWHAKVQACSEGILLPQWHQSSATGVLEMFLLVRRDGVIECGLGEEAYFQHEGDTYFLFIQIVGRFWQYLTFMNDLYERFFPNFTGEVLTIVNLRGTEESLLDDLADGWTKPLSHSISSFRPKCPNKHLQIQRKLSPKLTANDLEQVIRWYATRIDNAWGQFEPRCYVHENLDEDRPFARRKSR
jgi:hypothetical protein